MFNYNQVKASVKRTLIESFTEYIIYFLLCEKNRKEKGEKEEKGCQAIAKERRNGRK